MMHTLVNVGKSTINMIDKSKNSKGNKHEVAGLCAVKSPNRSTEKEHS